MTDSWSTWIRENLGFVHTGEGDLNIQMDQLARSHRKKSRRQAADELRWLHQRFVHPPEFDTAFRLLASRRTVFIDAPAESGRKTAARMLLWELETNSDSLHELVLQDLDEGPRIDLTHVGDGDLVWLDLSLLNEADWNAVRLELSGLRYCVQQRSAHLVVVLPASSRGLEPELREFCVKLGRPSPQEVFRLHLRHEGLVASTPLQNQELRNGPLKQITTLVELIIEARDSAGGEGDFAAWYGQAYQALFQQTAVVAEAVKRSSGPQRALLLATAMLHGAHAESVESAYVSLLTLAKQPTDEKSPLEQEALETRLQEIGAHLDAAGCVRFEQLHYDATVREYFWTHLPEVRKIEASWVAEIARSANLRADELADLVERFTLQFLTERYVRELPTLLEEWAEHSEYLGIAVLLLLHGLSDAEHGRIFRRQLYDWSRRNNPSFAHSTLIITACRGQMAAEHPDEAVVRLHHLARRERGTRQAHESLVELVRQKPRFLRQVLRRLAEADTGRWEADGRLFLDVADPAVLIADRPSGPLLASAEIRDQLGAGWRLALSGPFLPWEPPALRWLEHAAASPRHSEPLLRVLVAGGAQQTDVLARLHQMAQRADLRNALSRPLLREIDAAQGLTCD